jgi:CRP/FNR family cyclic AMP-dependent transcriptional regulator
MMAAGALSSLALDRALSRSAMFRALSRPEFDALLAAAHLRRFAAAAQICAEGASDGTLFNVARGRIRVTARSVDGEERHLNELGPGDVLGEIAVLDGGARSASAVAVDASELYCIDRSAFVSALERMPALARGVIELLCQRVRWLTELLEASAFLSLPARLARWLVMLSTQQGIQHAHGTKIRVSQQELAHFLGVSRQSVNAILQVWRGEGLVELGRGWIIVLDHVGLTRSAQ